MHRGRLRTKTEIRKEHPDGSVMVGGGNTAVQELDKQPALQEDAEEAATVHAITSNGGLSVYCTGYLSSSDGPIVLRTAFGYGLVCMSPSKESPTETLTQAMPGRLGANELNGTHLDECCDLLV